MSTISGERGDGGARGAGFTLVEVMVALVIVSVGLVTLLCTQARSTMGYAEARAMTVSDLLARRKLAELQAGPLPAPGETAGLCEENEQYAWALSVRKTALDYLREVVLEVGLAPAEGAEDAPRLGGVRVATLLVECATEEEEEDALPAL
ncbi:MAG: prepilin-type N-terminal cleavage/methylation domain-containing protein [bacterium]|nr:prepilin-type N-terminal cleavage/methylation domain-containing protein [bacterium]